MACCLPIEYSVARRTPTACVLRCVCLGEAKLRIGLGYVYRRVAFTSLLQKSREEIPQLVSQTASAMVHRTHSQ